MVVKSIVIQYTIKMKISHKNNEKKDKVKKKEVIKPKKEQVLIVAQEIKFARLLSGNEKKSRDKVLKTLKKWLQNCFEKRYEFKEDDFVRMWKGLFYAVWMSDKPLIQEELCENISGVLDLFPAEHLKYALLMYKAGLRVLATEWYGVDQHRMDKFLMLVRRYLRASLRCLARSQWSLSACQLYTKMLSDNDGILSLKTPRYARNATSMLLHILDCYLEEIAKVSEGDVQDASLAELLRPICRYMCAGEQPLVASGARRVLTALLRQSEHGIRYQQATNAWQKMGFPNGGPEALELVSDDEDIEQNGDENSDVDDDISGKPLDPRAGRVDVELPLLPVPADLLAKMLRDMLANASSKAHKRVRICLQRFEQLSQGEYPLRVPAELHAEEQKAELRPASVAHSLHTLEKQLINSSDELALRGLSRKHRKRLLAKSRSGESIVEHVERAREHPAGATNGEWQVETTEPEHKKHQENKSSKENKKRKSDSKENKHNKKRRIDRVNGEAKSKLKVDNNSNKTENNSVKNKNSTVDIKSEKVNISNGVKENGAVNNKKDIKKHNNDRNNKKEHKNQEKTITNGHYKQTDTNNIRNKNKKVENLTKNVKSPSVLVNKVKNFQKQSVQSPNKSFDTPKRVKFALKNNSMQAPVDYYKSIRQSPNIPFDGTKKPTKTNLKPSTPSPINPFFKKKMKLKY